MSRFGDKIAKGLMWQPFHPRWLNVLACVLFGVLGVSGVAFMLKTSTSEIDSTRAVLLTLWLIASILLLVAATGFVLSRPWAYLAVFISMLLAIASYFIRTELDFRILPIIALYASIAFGAYNGYRRSRANPNLLGKIDATPDPRKHQ